MPEGAVMEDLSISKPSKSVDTMIIETIGLLDELDKELKTLGKRVREWYGCHFPELSKIIRDDVLYAKSVKLMGNRSDVAKLDFSEILADEVEAELKEAALIYKGVEVCDLELTRIQELCDQVLLLADDRDRIYDNLKIRMNNVAPNLTALVGELLGARLISHRGSLMNLAKLPGSTVHILGAEKALFRPLTPKHGLIYNASLICQAAPTHKGKMSWSLATKIAIAIRCDVFGNGQNNTIRLESRAKLEARLRNLEGKPKTTSIGSLKK